MANPATKSEEKTLAKASEVQVLGKLSTDASFMEFLGEGFAQVETVVFGDEEDKKCSRYIGQLIGYGAPIERADGKTGEVRTQKTYAFHPMTRTADGQVGAVTNVTHVIPASYMMQAQCDRIMAEAVKRNKTAVVGFLYRGKVKTRSGFMVNDVAVFEKYV